MTLAVAPDQQPGKELAESLSPSSVVVLNSLSSDPVISLGISSSAPRDLRAVRALAFSLPESDLPHFTFNIEPFCVKRLQHPEALGGGDE